MANRTHVREGGCIGKMKLQPKLFVAEPHTWTIAQERVTRNDTREINLQSWGNLPIVTKQKKR